MSVRTAGAPQGARLISLRQSSLSGLGLFVLVDLFEFRIDHFVVTGLLRLIRRFFGRTLLLRLGIGLFGNLAGGFSQCLGLLLDQILIVALDGFLQRPDRRFDPVFLTGFQLVAELLHGLARGMDQGIALVACLHQLVEAAILLGVGLRFLDHARVGLTFRCWAPAELAVI